MLLRFFYFFSADSFAELDILILKCLDEMFIIANELDNDGNILTADIFFILFF